LTVGRVISALADTRPAFARSQTPPPLAAIHD
jgi:hypothetical protein